MNRRDRVTSMGVLIIAAWPETPVRPTGMWYDACFALLGLRLPNGLYSLGHAGGLLISERTGRSHYVDCGRYECPPGMCRIRDDCRDPDVALSVRARFAGDRSISNLDDVLLELSRTGATHGEGVMVASVIGNLRFEDARRTVRSLQGRIYPFRHLAARGESLNCTRFLLRVTRFANASWTVRLLEVCSRLAGPSPLFLTRLAGRAGPLFVIEDGNVSHRRRWSALLRGRPVLSTARHPEGGPAGCRGRAAVPQRPSGVPTEARWLDGTATGKWVALTHEPGFGPRDFRFRRWSESGQQDCDRTFALNGDTEFDPLRPFELGYPTDCQECTLWQDGRPAHLDRL